MGNRGRITERSTVLFLVVYKGDWNRDVFSWRQNVCRLQQLQRQPTLFHARGVATDVSHKDYSIPKLQENHPKNRSDSPDVFHTPPTLNYTTVSWLTSHL